DLQLTRPLRPPRDTTTLAGRALRPIHLRGHDQRTAWVASGEPDSVCRCGHDAIDPTESAHRNHVDRRHLRHRVISPRAGVTGGRIEDVSDDAGAEVSPTRSTGERGRCRVTWRPLTNNSTSPARVNADPRPNAASR